jgi:hypothetical protein
LTYKSIPDYLQQLETERKIVRFVPRTRGPSERRLYLTAAAEMERENPNSAANLLVGRGFIESSMTRWAAGNRIFADDRGKPRFLKELDPPPADMWEIRVTEPDVQARLIGAFAEQDTLILLKFSTRGLLRDKGSQGWKDALSEADTAWTECFGTRPRFHADCIGDYVSENCDAFTLKR